MKKKSVCFFLLLSCVCFITNGQDSTYIKECLEKDSMVTPDFYLIGFTKSQVSNLQVKRFHNNRVVSSFQLRINKKLGDSINLIYHGHFWPQYIQLHDTYEFSIPQHKKFIISNLKTTLSEVYQGSICEIGQYDLNGVTYKSHSINLINESYLKDKYQTDSMQSPTFEFWGFSFSEVNSAIVKHLHKGIAVDSFPFIIHKNRDTISKVFYGEVRCHFVKKDTYQICMVGEIPYLFSNFDKRVYTRDSMFVNEILNKYNLDSISYKDPYPRIIKHSLKNQIRTLRDSVESPVFKFLGFSQNELRNLITIIKLQKAKN